MSAQLAARVRRAFRQGSQGYSELEQLIINNRSDTQVCAIVNAYGRQAFERDLQAFVSRIPGGTAMQNWYRDRFVARLAQASRNPQVCDCRLSGTSPPGPSPPPAVLYTGDRQQIARWQREFQLYYQTQAGRQVAGRQTASWALRHWFRLWDGGDLRALATTCRIQPRNTEIFRASFSILSTRADARQIGIREGVRYFQGMAGDIRRQFRSVMSGASDYQESYVARTHPLAPIGTAPDMSGTGRRSVRGSPTDTQGVHERMRAWHDLHRSCGPLPGLTQQEQGYITNFRALVACWQEPPRPGHGCSQAAQRAGIILESPGP